MKPRYARYHEVLNRAVWSSRQAARILLVLLLQHLDGGDGPLIFGCEYSRKPLVKRGCSGSGPATAGGQLSMTRYLGTPPDCVWTPPCMRQQTHAASSPAMMSSSVCPWVGQTKLCRE